MRNARPWLLSAALALVSACASTRTSTEWKAPDLASSGVRKILVVGMARDEVARRVLEDGMVESLREKGIAAGPSWRVAPEGYKLTRAGVKQFARDAQADGVLLVRLTTTQEQTMVYPTWGFDPYWDWAYPTTYGPGYIELRTKVTVESRLFEENGELRWAGRSEAFDPSSLNEMARSAGAQIADKLGKAGALAAVRGKDQRG